MDIVVATHNAKKREELARILSPLGYKIVALPLSDVEETGATFEENARLKAKSGCKESGLPCIGDDSGLCVDALNGAPGIFSARFSGSHGDDAANISKLLKTMENTQIEDRSARFLSAICCIFPDGNDLVTHGICEGKIAFEPMGTGGFGYDPVFLPDEFPGYTMAQLSATQKDSISHRSRALAQMAKLLNALSR